MNTKTPITTAARRLARLVNSRYPESKLWFAADGTLVDETSAGMWYVNPADQHPDAVVILTGTRRTTEHLTHREAQDRLDAAAAHPADNDAQGGYLVDLRDARELATR